MIIVLNKGFFAEVDASSFDEINKVKWFIHNGGYAYRVEKKNGTIKHVYMHRMIMNPPENMVVDHINGDKLDNRKENLRICTQAENVVNSKVHKDNISGIKGVTWRKKTKKWEVRVGLGYKQISIGTFNSIEEAKNASQEARVHYHGEFAKI